MASPYTADDCDGLYRFFHGLATQLAHTYHQEFDDVIQDCIVEWLKSKHKYNPERGKPSTFFSWVIISRLPKKYQQRLKRTPKALTGRRIEVAAPEPETMPEGYAECLRLAENACNERLRTKALRAEIAKLAPSKVREAVDFVYRKEPKTSVFIEEACV